MTQPPNDMETKDLAVGPDGVPRVRGVSGDERLIGYSPSPELTGDGVADGRTPGVSNSPGKYEAPTAPTEESAPLAKEAPPATPATNTSDTASPATGSTQTD